MKILHTADIHLKSYDDDRWKALQELIEIGKKEKIEVFVISGDLFDKGIDAENLKPNIREIFSNTGFKIILIPGNHDKDSYAENMYFGEDITIIRNDQDNPVKYKDVRIWGIPFEPIEGENILTKLYSLKDKLTSDKKNILLYHGELLDAFSSRISRKDFGDEGEGRYMPVKLSYFKDLNVVYILAGHFHSRFDMWKLENGGYFVYPGSPISITKREIGQRKVNIFEVGEPPKGYLLDTPHFEEVVIEFDPFRDKNPIETVKKYFDNLHPKARAILTIKGFINRKVIEMGEKDLVNQIKKVVANKCVEEYYEFKDVQIILEDDLFKRFIEKLERSNYSKEKKKQLCDVVIRAIMRLKL